MPRTRRSARMDTRSARLRLEAGKRHMEPIYKGRYIVYRRPKSGAAGSWQACFVNQDTARQTRATLGEADDFQGADGKATLSYTQAHAAALAWFKEQERRANIEADGGDMPAGPFTVADAMKAYLDDGARRGMKGIRNAKGTARFWILPAFGHMEVSRLTRAKIEKWLDGIANSPRHTGAGKGKPAKELPPPRTDDERRARKSTVNRVLKTLKAALTFCIQRNLADSLDRPWQLVTGYKGAVKARIRFLTPDEQVKLVDACTGDFKDLVRGALLTGCRYGELTQMLCRDYDPKNGTVFVAESKSGKPRHIFLTQEGRKLFDWLTADSGPDDFIFTNGEQGPKKASRGQWRTNEQVTKMHDAYRKAGIGPTTFHELRHSYASTLVNSGCPMPVVAKLLGHASTVMTERHYAHLAKNTVRDELLRAMPTLGIV